MTWLFSLIWIPLLVCFALGAALSTAWWMWRRRAVNAEYEKRRLAAEAESDRLRLRVSSLKLSETRADDLQLELEKARTDSTRLPQLEKELKELRLQIGLVTELENQIINLRTRADQADRLERQLTDLESQLPGGGESNSKSSDELDSADKSHAVAADDQAEPVIELRPVIDLDHEAGETTDDASGEVIDLVEVTHRDDLKIIKGIGPALESKLNEMGIATWEQIAALTTGQIAAVGEEIAVFPGRIKRDDWVGQAASFVERFPLTDPYDRPSKKTLK
jgi:predicted flap endonuclease-1-like 5' DNA nuclease